MTSRPKRKAMAEMLESEADMPSRDAVTKLKQQSRDEAVALQQASRDNVTETPKPKAKAKLPRTKENYPGDVIRGSYHASVYLPAEAQFAIREIALMLRRTKPHSVMLEAMADLFDKYNKGDLAEECRSRIEPTREKPDSVTRESRD